MTEVDERSLVEDERLNKLLDAVAEVVLERGISGVTTALVARRARVAPGKFYELFADKYAVIQAAADRNVRRFFTALVAEINALDEVTLVDLGRVTLDTWVDFCRREPSFRVLRFEHASLLADEQDSDREARVVRAWTRYASPRFGMDESGALHRRLTLALKLILDPVNYAFELEPVNGDPEVLAQVRRLLEFHLSD